MKVTKNTPKWAVNLVTEVCKDYKRKLPYLLQWYNGSDEFSSGCTWRRGSKIHITAGTSGADQELVLLHELAHHILNKRKQQYHSSRFWRLAFELYERYDIDLGYAGYREEYYKKTASKIYQEVLAKK